MAITAEELIKRLQTYPPDQLVRVVSTDYGADGVLETMPDTWYLDGKIILQETKEDTWERGTYGDATSTDRPEDAEGSVDGTGGEKTDSHDE